MKKKRVFDPTRLSAIGPEWRLSTYPCGTTGQQGDIVVWIIEEDEA
ncbi:unnamed protein product [marine sediment metagenome]|uniref:Uncharacterized protein n=1 Tax=marine sediment metagenome TaxID=412755 RepID=X0VEE8_9ZZZZ